MDREILSFGTKIGNYVITRCIGRGGFSDIYMVCDTESDQAFAMKIEFMVPGKRTILQDELRFLSAVQGYPFYPRLIDFGQKNGIQYIVMELLGPNLTTLRRAMPEGRFKLSTVLKISLQTLIIIEDFHKNGIIHNDIKPDNFLLHPNSKTFLALTDFGLCTIAGKHNKIFGFHGTKMYASPGAHNRDEFTAIDDIYGWFYSIFEMFFGTLPWRGVEEEQKIYEMKISIKDNELYKNLPIEFQNIYEIIEETGPDEEFYFDDCFAEIMNCFERCDVPEHEKFEWEEFSVFEEMKISAIPLTLKTGKYAIEPDHNAFAVNEDGQLSVMCTAGSKLKQYHPVSTVCRI